MFNATNSAFTEPLHLPKHLEQMIKEHSEEQHFPAKKRFLEAGETIEALYYIHHGRTKHCIVSEDGSEKIMYTLGDGWFFGETPIIVGSPTGLVSETMEPTTMWIIPKNYFLSLFDQDKDFRDLIVGNMARKMLILRHEIGRISFAPVKKRILHLLCSTADTSEVIDNAWHPLQTKYTQYDIANIVGSARVTTSKLINELCDEGKIRSINHTMQVSKECVESVIKDFSLS